MKLEKFKVRVKTPDGFEYDVSVLVADEFSAKHVVEHSLLGTAREGSKAVVVSADIGE